MSDEPEVVQSEPDEPEQEMAAAEVSAPIGQSLVVSIREELEAALQDVERGKRHYVMYETLGAHLEGLRRVLLDATAPIEAETAATERRLAQALEAHKMAEQAFQGDMATWGRERAQLQGQLEALQTRIRETQAQAQQDAKDREQAARDRYDALVREKEHALAAVTQGLEQAEAESAARREELTAELAILEAQTAEARKLFDQLTSMRG